MNSIYEQMNRIDDAESLNKKYDVRTLKDVKKLQEAAAPRSDRSSIKTRVNELIDMVDWSKWEKFTSTGDDTKPKVKKTRASDDGIRVDVYLGWDYRHKDDIEDYVKAVNEKFEAFAAIVRKQEPSWSVKLVKSHGSRGVTWTNYWAQVTAKLSITESVHDYFNIDKYYIRGNDEDAIQAIDDPDLAEYLVKCEEVDPGCKHVCWLIARDEYLDALDEFDLVELVDRGDEVGEFPAVFVRDRVYNITEEIMHMLGI